MQHVALEGHLPSRGRPCGTPASLFGSGRVGKVGLSLLMSLRGTAWRRGPMRCQNARTLPAMSYGIKQCRQGEHTLRALSMLISRVPMMSSLPSEMRANDTDRVLQQGGGPGQVACQRSSSSLLFHNQMKALSQGPEALNSYSQQGFKMGRSSMSALEHADWPSTISGQSLAFCLFERTEVSRKSGTYSQAKGKSPPAQRYQTELALDVWHHAECGLLRPSPESATCTF